MLVPCAAAALAAAVLVPAQSSGAGQERTRVVRLPAHAGALVTGTGGSPVLRGLEVSPAGDFNGDGRPDLIAGASSLSALDRPAAGSALVSSARPRRGRIEVGHSPQSLRIVGPTARGHAGRASVGVGDVNGDGLEDVALTAPGVRSGLRSVYVTFGRRAPGTIDLAHLGSAGFRIDVPAAEADPDRPERGGDINGDGLADLVVTWAEGDRERSFATVIFGRGAAEPVRADEPGGGGFLVGMFQAAPGSVAVAESGDLNGDGLGDLLLGVGNEDTPCQCGGGAFALYGKRDSAGVNVDRLGAGGVTFAGGQSTVAVAGPGDVTGDGLPDALIATGAGVHVVGGGRLPDRVDLRRLGRQGYLIRGVSFLLTGLGDMNGDRINDFAADNYVIYGSRSRRDLRRTSLGRRGFRIDDSRLAKDAIISVATMGDIDRDRRADLLVSGLPIEGRSRELDSLIYGRSRPYVAIGSKRHRGSPPRGADLTASARLGLRVPLLCPATAARRCRGYVTLRHGRRVLRRVRFSIAAGRTVGVRAAAPCRAGRRARIRARAAARAADGRPAVTRRRLVVRCR
jgi:FG-GAP repeat